MGAKDHQVPQGGKAAWDVLDPLDQEDSLAHQATATLLHVLATMLEVGYITLCSMHLVAELVTLSLFC